MHNMKAILFTNMKLDEIVLTTEFIVDVAENIVKKLKPTAEEVSGLKLSKPKITLSETEIHSSMEYYHNEIFINRKFWKSIGFDHHRTLYDFEFDIAHELGHHVSYNINPRIAINETRFEIIDEGFAEYFSLDLLPKGILSEKVVDSYRNWLLESSSFRGIGYRFFRKVIDILCKEEAFSVIKNLDTTPYELKVPFAYIHRRENGKNRNDNY